MQLSDVAIPSTVVAGRSLDVVRRFASPSLVNHSQRSYLWAASYGIAHSIGFDAELLYVSAMLHDIGLAEAFDNHSVPFEYAGGNVAWVFGAGAGWSDERCTRASEVIVRHMWKSVDPIADPEGFLLEIATSLDITGKNPQWWSANLRAEVVECYPRLALRDEFTACFRAEAARKPQSSAAVSLEGGLAQDLAMNVLEDNR